MNISQTFIYLQGIYRVRLHLAQTFHLDAQVLDCPFLQPIGLVDYKPLKKSICHVRLFSSRFLKQFMDWASTSSCDRLFHLLMTLWEKKYKRESQRQCFFTNFQVCPLVEVSSAVLKNVTNEWMSIPSSFQITRTSLWTSQILCWSIHRKPHQSTCAHIITVTYVLAASNCKIVMH